ncbi:MAG: PilZ domain-containing protein [Candidatus Omnitrophica bacterium]|nr:PilZ domain-containing protein [Candidatus Omnitrophota bacterium]
MTKKEEFIDRRGSIRLKIPVDITYQTSDRGRIHTVTAKDISAEGARFEAHDKRLKESDIVEMKLGIPEMSGDGVRATGTVIWKRRLSLEDKSPFDIGIEFGEIAEDGKNSFLKFLCDFIYKLPEEKKRCGR